MTCSISTRTSSLGKSAWFPRQIALVQAALLIIAIRRLFELYPLIGHKNTSVSMCRGHNADSPGDELYETACMLLATVVSKNRSRIERRYCFFFKYFIYDWVICPF